jgi:hypothetical protein
MVSTPQGPSSQRHRLGEGRLLGRRPGGRAPRGRLRAEQVGCRQRAHRGAPAPCGCRAADAPVVPRPWGVEPERRPRRRNGRCPWPALDAPGQKRHGGDRPCRGPPGLGCTIPGRITEEDPPPRPWRQTRGSPDNGGGRAVDPTGCRARPRRDGDPRPGGGGAATRCARLGRRLPGVRGRPFGVGFRAGAGAERAASRRQRVTTPAPARTASRQARAASVCSPPPTSALVGPHRRPSRPIGRARSRNDGGDRPGP